MRLITRKYGIATLTMVCNDENNFQYPDADILPLFWMFCWQILATFQVTYFLQFYVRESEWYLFPQLKGKQQLSKALIKVKFLSAILGKPRLWNVQSFLILKHYLSVKLVGV